MGTAARGPRTLGRWSRQRRAGKNTNALGERQEQRQTPQHRRRRKEAQTCKGPMVSSTVGVHGEGFRVVLKRSATNDEPHLEECPWNVAAPLRALDALKSLQGRMRDCLQPPPIWSMTSFRRYRHAGWTTTEWKDGGASIGMRCSPQKGDGKRRVSTFLTPQPRIPTKRRGF